MSVDTLAHRKKRDQICEREMTAMHTHNYNTWKAYTEKYTLATITCFFCSSTYDTSKRKTGCRSLLAFDAYTKWIIETNGMSLPSLF